MRKLREHGSPNSDHRVTLLQDDGNPSEPFIITARSGQHAETLVQPYKDRTEAERAYKRLVNEPVPGEPSNVRDPYDGASKRYAAILRESMGKRGEG